MAWGAMGRAMAARVTMCASTLSSSPARIGAALGIAMLAGAGALTWAGAPQGGLDPRVSLGAFMSGALPANTGTQMPGTLQETGVFTNLASRTPHPGLIPYELNSPLWTDGADKSRFLGVPYDSDNPNHPTLSPKIGFAPTGKWTFPNGTVIVKNFDMRVSYCTTDPVQVRRLETRILVRSDDGTIRGASYKWFLPAGATATNPARSDGEMLLLRIREADCVTERDQNYQIPSPNQCVRCHNANAGMVLGIRTAQLNGDLTYPTGRTDNQLAAMAAVGLFNQVIGAPSSYDETVDIDDATATYEHRIRSYLSSNCAHCHQDGGEGPTFDMRFELPSELTNIFGPPGNGLLRGDHLASKLYQRDASNTMPMPPLARNVPDQRVLQAYVDWTSYDFDVTRARVTSGNAITLTFSKVLEAASANVAAHYQVDGGVTVSAAQLQPGGLEVVLSTSTVTPSTSYTVTVNRVRESALPQQVIFPQTRAATAVPPGAPTLTVVTAGTGTATLSFTAPAFAGGAPVTGYEASCTGAGLNIATGSGSPLTVTGLTPGASYQCNVRAQNEVGFGPASATLSVVPLGPPALLDIVSRKTHGSAGDFDIPLRRVGPASVEPRGGAHRIVFRYNNPVTNAGSIAITGGSATTAIEGSTVVVTLAGINDGDQATVSLTGVNGSVDASVTVGFLVGDVDGSRGTGPTDILAVRARSGAVADADTARYDLDASGSVTAADILAAKARQGRQLP